MKKITAKMYVISKREGDNEASFLTGVDVRNSESYDYERNSIMTRSVPLYGSLDDAMLFASLEFAVSEVATLGIELSSLVMEVTVEASK